MKQVPMNTGMKKMRDEDATPLDWFILDMFSREIFGDRFEQLGINHIKKEEPVAATTGSVNTSKSNKV